jgi:hypothetical protein
MAATRTRCICRKFTAQVSAWDVDGYDIADGDMIEAQAQTAHECRVTDETLNEREHAWAQATGRCYRDYAEIIREALITRMEEAAIMTYVHADGKRIEVPASSLSSTPSPRQLTITERQADTLAAVLTSRLAELDDLLATDDAVRDKISRIEQETDPDITPVRVFSLTPAVRSMYRNERHDIRILLTGLTGVAPV